MDKKIIGLLLLVIFLTIAISFVANPNKPLFTSNLSKSSPTPTNPTLKEGQITLINTGFSPLSLTIDKGTRITWINNSGQTGNVSSDPHPIHNLYPILNIGNIDNNSTASVIFENPGTYTYHNHLQPSQKGTIIVE